MRSGNPTLSDSIVYEWEGTVDPKNVMGIQGMVNKTLILLAVTILSAIWVWSSGVWANATTFMTIFWFVMIGELVLVMASVFRKKWVRITSPIYALLTGILLGSISMVVESSYPGIVPQAIALTFGVFFCLLLVYKLGLIKVTKNLMTGVLLATFAIFLIYAFSIIGWFIGFQIPLIHESGPIGIVFSLFVVSIASLNLLLDFHLVEEVARLKAPKYMEWYCAFGLIVTLTWLYLEILRLLYKLSRGGR